jgi:hypothetical protein
LNVQFSRSQAIKFLEAIRHVGFAPPSLLTECELAPSKLMS